MQKIINDIIIIIIIIIVQYITAVINDLLIKELFQTDFKKHAQLTTNKQITPIQLNQIKTKILFKQNQNSTRQTNFNTPYSLHNHYIYSFMLTKLVLE